VSPDRPDALVILVAGGARVDAGKTTFSTGLVADLAARAGDAVGGVNPAPATTTGTTTTTTGSQAIRGGSTERRETPRGREHAIAGERWGSGAVLRRSPESINPVHRLWRPTPDRTGMLGDTDRTFLCDRVTTEGGSRFVVNRAARPRDCFPTVSPTDSRSRRQLGSTT